ncbi:MAG: hypothetical protein IT209_04955 [Armatimonadetes bacterium]|nr:hypothetical protein [Armatimonadota bacterium]
MRGSMRAAALTLAAMTISAVAYAQGSTNAAAFQKFRSQHKYTFQLSTTVFRGLAECERTDSTKLKPAQAKQILSVLNPLRKQSKLTQDQAKSAIQKIQRALDQKQLSAIDKVLNSNARPGFSGSGNRPGNATGARPGGNRPGGPAAGNRPAFDPSKMKDFNPFNPSKTSPNYERQLDRVKRLFSFLEARSANKPATLQMMRPGQGSPRAGEKRPGNRPGAKPAPRRS